MKNNYEKKREGMDGRHGMFPLQTSFRSLRRSMCYFFLLSVFFTSYQVSAQSIVTGTVQEGDTGEPLPGVTIQVKGTTTGVITDLDGKYRISASPEDVLMFSFIGFQSQEITVGSKTEISVNLETDVKQLGEVVVTAFGLKREKKALTYSAQKISTDEFSEARSLNVANSLSGKVAGLTFSATGNGVGASSRITLRGNRSLTGNNQPMYVIDGVPMDNSIQDTPGKDAGGPTSFDGISNINPEDIESMSVLKGPSAAALYGTRASNGVIIITTKTGSQGKGARVSLSSNLMFSKAYELLSYQNQYGQGNQGVYDPTSKTSWGPRMNGQMVDAWQLQLNPDYDGPATRAFSPQPDNVYDFFKIGYNWSKALTVNMGNKDVQGYFSYTNTEAEGIVGGNNLDRHNANVRLTGNLSDRLKLDAKANYINQKIKNAYSPGETSLGGAVYGIPRSFSHDEYKHYSYIDAVGDLRQYYPQAESSSGQYNNPYWVSKQNPRVDERHRFIGMSSLKFDFTDHLSLQARIGFDQSTDLSTVSKYASQSTVNNDFGSYEETQGVKREVNTDFLLAYDRTFGNVSVSAGFGGNALHQDRKSTTVSGRLTRRNFFSLTNLQVTTASPYVYEKKINSLYGFARFGFKEYLFLDITGRNDWSSALPADNRSFFYPSIGLSGVLSDIFEIDSDVLTFLKARASFAQVGNDTDPYKVLQTYLYSGGNAGILQADPQRMNPNLKPEISTSVEFGLDSRFFNNRIGFDVTYYQTKTKDQIFVSNTSESSGYESEIVNGGEIKNEGIELVLNAKVVEMKDFSWDVTANYSSYETKVVSLSDGREEFVVFGERLANSVFKVGGQYGDLYVKGYERNENGQVIVNSEGVPQITPSFTVKAGNFNPDWIGGLQNRLNYKNISLSFLVDFRVGGEVLSYTQSQLAGIGVSDVTLRGREDGFIVDGVTADGSVNTVRVSAQDYWTQIASSNSTGEDFVYSATNIRLRELVLGYNLPSKMLKGSPFSSVNFSLVGRNLFFIVNKAEYFDPEQGISVGNLQGIESFNLPTTRDFGFNLKANF